MRALGRRQLGRDPAAVLPVVDQAGEMARRPALGVDVLGFQQLLDQPLLVVDVDDGVARLQPDQFGVAAQDLRGDGMEGADPAQALGGGADDRGDPLASPRAWLRPSSRLCPRDGSTPCLQSLKQGRNQSHIRFTPCGPRRHLADATWTKQCDEPSLSNRVANLRHRGLAAGQH